MKTQPLLHCQRLERARRWAGLEQSTAARRLGWGLNKLRDLESGLASCTDQDLVQLAIEYDVRLRWLTGPAEDIPPGLIQHVAAGVKISNGLIEEVYEQMMAIFEPSVWRSHLAARLVGEITGEDDGPDVHGH